MNHMDIRQWNIKYPINIMCKLLTNISFICSSFDGDEFLKCVQIFKRSVMLNISIINL